MRENENKSLNSVNFKENSFTLFRYIAAFQVLLNHGDHLNIRIPDWIDMPFRLFQGVPLFFGLSGFLIWNSLNREECLKVYSKKRFLRLYPELWIAVAISLLSIIVLYKAPINWPMLGAFTIGQASVLQFWTPSFLDGFGIGTPNGSLWTIPIFVQFYIIIFFLYKQLKNKPLKVWMGIFVTALALNISFTAVGGVLHGIVYKLYGQTVLPYFYLFFLGSMASRYFDNIIPFLKKFWWMFLLLDAFFLISGFDLPGRFGPLRTICLIMAVIGLAYTVRVKLKVDLSYEFYLIHMVVINIFVQLEHTGNYGWFVLALLLSLLISILMNVVQKRIVKRFIH